MAATDLADTSVMSGPSPELTYPWVRAKVATSFPGSETADITDRGHDTSGDREVDAGDRHQALDCRVVEGSLGDFAIEDVQLVGEPVELTHVPIDGAAFIVGYSLPPRIPPHRRSGGCRYRLHVACVPLPSAKVTGAAGDTTPTDPRSRRNRASRRGGQLLTRARGSSSHRPAHTFVLPVPLSRMVAPYAAAKATAAGPSAPAILIPVPAEYYVRQYW